MYATVRHEFGLDSTPVLVYIDHLMTLLAANHFLSGFIRDLQLDEYIDLYWRDYPSFIKTFKEACVIDQGTSPIDAH